MPRIDEVGAHHAELQPTVQEAIPDAGVEQRIGREREGSEAGPGLDVRDGHHPQLRADPVEVRAQVEPKGSAVLQAQVQLVATGALVVLAPHGRHAAHGPRVVQAVVAVDVQAAHWEEAHAHLGTQLAEARGFVLVANLPDAEGGDLVGVARRPRAVVRQRERAHLARHDGVVHEVHVGRHLQREVVRVLVAVADLGGPHALWVEALVPEREGRDAAQPGHRDGQVDIGLEEGRAPEREAKGAAQRRALGGLVEQRETRAVLDAPQERVAV